MRVVLRAMAVVCLLLGLYYLQFFVTVRQDIATVVEIAILLAAAAMLVAPAPGRLRIGRAMAALIAVVGVAAMVAVFWWADNDSHSASDTLARGLPAMCLIAALTLRIVGSHFYNRSGAHS